MNVILWVVPILMVGCNSKPKYPKGGYDYPDPQTTSIDTNNYSFPIRDLISTSDSFNYVYYDRFWHKGYDEPNLSLKFSGQDVFRLTFKSAFRDGAIITVLNNKIISKQWIKGDPYPQVDSSKLTPLEKHLYELLYWNFPIQHLEESRRQKLDSIAKMYPQLLDPLYYRYLLDKSLIPNKDSLVYEVKEVTISKSTYRSLLKLITASGYWNMPYEINCEGYTITHGYRVLLEANTSRKYNIVTRFGCPSDDSKFIETCQEIIDEAKLKRAIKLLPENNSQ